MFVIPLVRTVHAGVVGYFIIPDQDSRFWLPAAFHSFLDFQSRPFFLTISRKHRLLIFCKSALQVRTQSMAATEKSPMGGHL